MIGLLRVLRLVVPFAVIAAWTSTGAAGAEAAGRAVALGAYVADTAETPTGIDRFAEAAGRDPVVVSVYKQWDAVPFDSRELEAIWRRGAVPMVAWEPMSYHGRDFPLSAIQRGHFDEYVRRSAGAARRWGRPILLRFAHEMNGDWYPWGRGVAGNNSYRYRAVWRRLVGIFRNRRATNVEWVWTPNVNTGGDHPFLDLYPGDRWVDWVGFDGFNWGEGGEWNSFTEIVDNSYEELARLTDRPMIVAETGSDESGGDKAAWTSSALTREIPRFSRIRAVVFFDAAFEDADARIDSSADSLTAFRASLDSPAYGLSRSALLSTPPDFGRGFPTTAPPAPEGGFGEPPFIEKLWYRLRTSYLWAMAGLLALSFLVLILALHRWRRRGLLGTGSA